MEKCYKTGGCGVYENRSCANCPASKPEYELKEKNINIYVATLHGDIKDNYMAIGFSEKAAIQNVLFAFFKDYNHTIEDLVEHKAYVLTIPFENGKTNTIY